MALGLPRPSAELDPTAGLYSLCPAGGGAFVEDFERIGLVEEGVVGLLAPGE